MKVTDSNLSSLAATETSRTQTGRSSGGGQNAATWGTAGDDIHLSELVRSLRALTAGSPDRQARIDQIAQDYMNGTYQVNAHATASKLIDDASEP
ncbi:MAG TPA: flagellar biosynthesis anti-sigma factor FlgM [Bryobacteraceae bacterium]|nr:flagellar biosynthesis anti-sigma factor FlgM [Bryobacteraceae bacterium]